jgi:hypothetical protein
MAFPDTDTIYQQLTDKPTNTNPNGIYQLKCNTCNNAYIGQSEKSITIRHKEHIRHIRTNSPTSAYALHNTLDNRHEYGMVEETLKLLKSCHKGTKMNCWESLYMQGFYQNNILIVEQQVNDINPLYQLAYTTHDLLSVP